WRWTMHRTMKMTTKRFFTIPTGLIAFALCLGLAAGAVSARETKRKPGHCSKEDGCGDCSGVNACKLTCDGEGCVFRHSGLGAARSYGPAGGCRLEHSGAGLAVLHCEGGNCDASCTGVGKCVLADCDQGCHVDCQGAGKCEGP